MFHTLICVASLFVTVQGSILERYFPRNVVRILSVDNGGQWGDWHEPDFCADGTFASGYKMKIEPPQGNGDDTALNAITLQCEDAKKSMYGGQVRSGSGYWGDWSGFSTCKFQTGTQDFLTAFSLQVEPPQGGSVDDTAANFVKFMCQDLPATKDQYELALYPGKGVWGSYGGWSKKCPMQSAICGIQTRIEKPQGKDDDTALNDVRFFCCT
ncbi:hypothetical protein CHS0354_033396 [Potamilus streckersoni]|uniref:Vitelline membrane outer layer protein 1 homolog n=1 Tax=Potamilus streckersoni TaxID=2493646 RepID=A0AAE0SR42_9BIVA|nr:hypothetical protein CHS0354_033396 [Potamilus streckersoni]